MLEQNEYNDVLICKLVLEKSVLKRFYQLFCLVLKNSTFLLESICKTIVEAGTLFAATLN